MPLITEGENPGVQEWIRDEARAYGFSRIGFADLRGEFPEGEQFRAWLSRGYHGEMSWLERTAARRSDPRRVLAGVRTAIVLAFDYPPPDREPDALEGRVASYARGRDYHNVLGRRLRKYVRALRQHFPGHQFYSSLDTGVVLEKAMAVRAGLGWQAKNSLVLHPEHGSYFLLAVVLATLELTPSAPFVEQCGDCRLCIDACPTGAFAEPFVVDARRCISYLTIETREAYPAELREAVGDHLFGCDVCQTVCPWNLSATPAEPDPGFAASEVTGHEALVPLLASVDALPSFRGRALARPGPSGIVRAAVVVAGNQKSSRWQGPLSELLAHENEAVRAHAAWALGRLGGRAVVDLLRAAAAREISVTVKSEIERALMDAEP